MNWRGGTQEIYMSALRTFRLLLIASVLSYPVIMAEYIRGWPFQVTYSCLPNFSISLTSGREVLEYKITLQHQLISNGERYESRLFMPELESYLVQEGNAIYKWRTIDGDIVLLSKARRTNFRGRNWTVTTEGSEIQVFEEESGETYKYERCRLAYWKKHGITTAFKRKESEVNVFRRNNDQMTTVAVLKRISANAYELKAGERLLKLLYNKDLQLENVMDLSDGRVISNFTYQGALLKRIDAGPLQNHYEWAEGSFEESFASVRRIEPFIVMDRSATYHLKRTQAFLEVEFFARSQTKNGRWVFDLNKQHVNLMLGE